MFYSKFKNFFFLGQWLIEKARPDIIRKFAPLLQEDIGMIPQYIFQCNAQKPRHVIVSLYEATCALQSKYLNFF